MKKNKSLSINAFLNLIKNGITIIFPLITYPYLFRVLHAQQMGKYNFAASIVSYFALFATLGTTTYAIREGSKIREDKKKIESFSNLIFSFNILTTFISFLILLTCSFFIPNLFSSKYLIILLGCSIIFTTLGIEWVNIIYEDFLYITIRSIIIQLISLILILLFVKKPSDIYIYAFIIVISNALVCFLNLFYCKKYIKLKIVKINNIIIHLKPIFYLFANNIATTIYVNSDLTMIGLILGDYYVGIYSLTVKIYTVIKNMLAALYSVVIPRISFFYNKGNLLEVKRIYTKLVSGLILFLLPISCGIILLSKNIIILMGGYEYLEGIFSLQVLSIALIGAIIGGTIVYCLNLPLGKEKNSFYATTISAIINITLNIIMIPFFKQNGAAITTAISEFFVCFYSLFLLKNIREYLDIKLFLYNVFCSVIGVITIIIIYLLLSLLNYSIWVNMILLIIISFISYFIELLLLKNDILLTFIKKIKIGDKNEKNY